MLFINCAQLFLGVLKMLNKKRWALFKHVGALNDPLGKHFDLMLEDHSECRSWRLNNLPIIDGPPVKTILIKPHKLEWLDREYLDLSNARGIVTRLEAGTFSGLLPISQLESFKIQLLCKRFVGEMEIKNSLCRIISMKENIS